MHFPRGLILKKSYMLLPWLVIYFIIIVSAYMAGILVVLSSGEVTSCFLSMFTGGIFNLIWLMVRSSYRDMQTGEVSG